MRVPHPDEKEWDESGRKRGKRFGGPTRRRQKPPLHLLPNGKWPEDVFGWVLLLEYDENGHLNAALKDENLMPGVAANPPPQPST